MTWQKNTAVALSAATLFTVGAVGVWRFWHHRQRESGLSSPFHIEPCKTLFDVSEVEQALDLTLRLNIDSLVDWIAIRFEEGTYPLEIKGLHDFGRNEVPHNVDVRPPMDGARD